MQKLTLLSSYIMNMRKKIYLSYQNWKKKIVCNFQRERRLHVVIVRSCYGQIDLKIIFTNKNTIGSLFRFKERLPKALLSSVIYEFRCAQCASGTYIGSTIRSLHMRIAEHRGRSFRTGKEIQSSKSSVRDHSQSCSNPVSIDNFRVLGQEKHETHLRILESLHILRLKPNLNEMQSAFPLKIAY